MREISYPAFYIGNWLEKAINNANSREAIKTQKVRLREQ